ncbi:MAG TPA: 4-hydroxyacetophenone monooxygenase, partial [Pseudonocardiaceae bacterium]
RYLRQAMQLARERAAAVDVRADVMAASAEAVQQRFAGTAWLSCQSWYRDATGRIVTNWPGYMREYAHATSRLDPSDFSLIERAPVAADQGS